MSGGSTLKGLYLPLLALLLFSRFSSAPVTDFLGDDWPILERGRNYASYADAAGTALHEPDRPIGALLLGVVFRAIDDRPALFTLHNIILHGIILLLFLYCVNRLTDSRRATAIAGVVFALLPHAADLYNWATVAVYLPAFVCYLGAAACWIRYTRGGKFAWAPVSGLLMLIGSATFESGFALPLAFLALVRKESIKRDLAALAFPCAGSGLYLLWRFTRGFGLAQGILFDPRKPAMDPYYLAWNAKEFVSSWLGENLITTLSQGLAGFGTLSEWEWRGLFCATLIAVVAICAGLSRMKTEEPISKTKRMSAIWFAILWFAMAALPCVVSWQAGRLQFLPGMAVALVAGVLLADRPIGNWIPALGLAALVLLPVNLGSAQLWQDSGRLHRRLFTYLETSQPEWTNADVVLFSTESLRRRLTPGLLSPDSRSPYVWAKYGSADLLRGFAPAAMLRMAQSAKKTPASLLDTEHGAHWETNDLYWHDRWNPDKPHRTPRNKVYEVDILDVISRQPDTPAP